VAEVAKAPEASAAEAKPAASSADSAAAPEKPRRGFVDALRDGGAAPEGGTPVETPAERGATQAPRGPPADEAWQKIQERRIQGVSQSNGNTRFTVDMGRRVGRTGGKLAQQGGSVGVTHVRIVVRTGTNHVITAFPVQ
jgi:hypothetical protein